MPLLRCFASFGRAADRASVTRRTVRYASTRKGFQSNYRARGPPKPIRPSKLDPYKGRNIYFGTLTNLVSSLEEAKAAGRLDRRLKILTHPALLVVDEIGYLPVTQSGAILFFQLVNRRYGNGSTALTSNKGFGEWGRILGDEVMAVALLDRLLHRCHIVNIRGNRYRMRRHAELSKVIHPLAS